MSEPDANSFIETAAWIAPWKRPLLLTHAKPDGDALGSLVAMRSILQSTGADPLAVLLDPIPGRYVLFQEYAPMPLWGAEIDERGLEAVDGVLVLDTCAYIQLGPIADWLRAADVPKLAVDHHITRDELADRYLIDESAAANCLILYEWAKAAGWRIDEEAAEALFVGIAMDTGWFRFSNTDARTLTAASELVARGVSSHELYERLFQRESSGRVRLMGTALRSMELLAEDHLAMMTLEKDDFTTAGAEPADTEDIVNEPLRIGSVVVSVLLVDQKDGIIRASFRSTPPTSEPRASARANMGTARVPHHSQSKRWETDIDVATIAQTFGGGGHTRAAGARITGTLHDVRQKIADHLHELLSDPGNSNI